MTTELNWELIARGPLVKGSLPTRAFTSRPLPTKARPEAMPMREPIKMSLQIGPYQRGASGEASISCLMVTRDRMAQAQLAIKCFLRQTWPNRELVILDTTNSDGLARWVASLRCSMIRIKSMPGCMDRLGDLRNAAVAAAGGDYVCQWDDDDLSHPLRLEVQFAALRATKARVSFLLSELIWMPRTDRIGVLEERAHENSMVCERNLMPAYPSLGRDEDTPVCETLMRSQPTVYVDHPELYIYLVHGANTWHDAHMETMWRNSKHRFTGGRYPDVLTRLAASYPIEDTMRTLGVSPKARTASAAKLASRGRPKWKGYFINLDRSRYRRAHIEQQLAALGIAGKYQRFAAIDGNQLAESSKLSSAEAAIYRSHLSLLERAATDGHAVHIIEDDVILCDLTVPAVDAAVQTGAIDDYDILFLDFMPMRSIVSLRRLYRLYQECTSDQSVAINNLEQLKIIDIDNLYQWGTTSYVVGLRSIDRVLSVLNDELRRGPTLPYDMAIQAAVRSRALHIGSFFPFISITDLELGAASDAGRGDVGHGRSVQAILRHTFFVRRDINAVAAPALAKMVDRYRRPDPDGALDVYGDLMRFYLIEPEAP